LVDSKAASKTGQKATTGRTATEVKAAQVTRQGDSKGTKDNDRGQCKKERTTRQREANSKAAQKRKNRKWQGARPRTTQRKGRGKAEGETVRKAKDKVKMRQTFDLGRCYRGSR
jgi:hypothetical protein